MTKLLEWLFGVGIFLGTWFAIISGRIQAHLLEEWMSVIIPLPLLLPALFGVSIVVPQLRIIRYLNTNGFHRNYIFVKTHFAVSLHVASLLRPTLQFCYMLHKTSEMV